MGSENPYNLFFCAIRMKVCRENSRHFVSCVAGAKRGGGREKGKREGIPLPLSPIPSPFSLHPYPLSPIPYPLPVSTPATQANISRRHHWFREMTSFVGKPLVAGVAKLSAVFSGEFEKRLGRLLMLLIQYKYQRK